MNHFKILILFIFCIGFTPALFCQSLQNFGDVLSAKKIGQVFTRKVGEDISKQTYLGIVRDRHGDVNYYVVKEFLRVKAALVYHGHSRILFFNKAQELTAQVIVSLPGELPFKLRDNTLYFKYSDVGVKKVYIQDISVLSKVICVKPNSCYEISTL